MSSAPSIEARLSELGIVLPDAPVPVANYVPFTTSANLLFVSGQVPAALGDSGKGILGQNVSVEQGQQIARACGLAILAQANAALGTLNNVTRVLKLGGFVACTPEFEQHPAVINGASDLMVDVFGDLGRHARFAVGVPSLPLGFAVEVDAVLEIKA